MDQSPERYAAAARLVAAWLERLRAAAARPRARRGGRAAPRTARITTTLSRRHGTGDAWDERESGAAPGGMDLPLTPPTHALTATAFAIRYGEVTGWLASRRRRRAIATATAGAGAGGWCLTEAGDAAGDPFVAYRRLEADPVTGSGVLVETRPDDALSGVIHAVRRFSSIPPVAN